jgi:hypothetical protein
MACVNISMAAVDLPILTLQALADFSRMSCLAVLAQNTSQPGPVASVGL